jgi:uncharacterized protein YecE (DUF72 family)
VKAPRLITHFRRFHNAQRETDDFYKSVKKGLAGKLGCVLFQLHPGMPYTDENLDRILDTLDPSFTNVLEFRHASWWNTDVLKVLKENRITFCGISYPDLPEDVHKTASVMYYRFHGLPQLYLSSYSKRELTAVSDTIKRFRAVTDIFCYFNNDIEVAAVNNAKTLQSLTESFPVLSSAK